jgi:Asp-tRNA(Asn)/Glu-tRNA(Gln) amidotransferase A subunit family amidase
MALSWSMDKIGAICRSVEDCALVLDVIHGPDEKDNCAQSAAFNWDVNLDWHKLRVGYLKSEFEAKPPDAAADAEKAKSQAALSPEDRKKAEDKKKAAAESQARSDYDRRYDLAALDKLRALGVTMTAVELPDLPYDAMVSILLAEAAAAFDELTRTGRDKLLTAQGPEDWPNQFRVARLIPAVEYVNASRARALAMQKMAVLFRDYDVIVAPSNSKQLVVTNLTGHPALILPSGFRAADAPVPPAIDTGDEDNIGGPGTPVSLTFLGGLYQEAKLLALARVYQEATDFHLQRPPLDEFLKKSTV